jgi:hypothetical protein
MNEQNIRIIKRLLREIVHVMGKPKQFPLFLGMNVALIILYEECTGNKCINMKPQDVIEWAKNLPEPAGKIVTLN